MEIELYSKMQNPMDAIDRIGEFFAKSGMFGCDNVNAGKVLATICMTERKSPVELLRTYDIVEGKLRKKAMAAFAEFRQRGGKVKWIDTGDDGKKASAEFTFEGQTVPLSFTIEQAHLAGLVKDKSGWKKSPGNMLRARLISNALGMLCPELFAGEDYGEDGGSAAELKLSNVQGENVDLRPVAATETQDAPQEKPASRSEVQTAEVVTEVQNFKPGPEYSSANTQTLPAETVEKLKSELGDNMTVALQWCVKNGWLTEDQTIAHLTNSRAKRILLQTQSFLRAIQPADAKG